MELKIKLNIVHLEDFFHPDAGYQINILPKYMVKQGHEVTIVTSEMEKIPTNLTTFFTSDNILEADKNYTELTGVRIIRLPLKTYISGRAVFKKKLFQEIDKLKPDILYVHGNDTLTGIRYLLNRKKLSYPIIMDSHMLEMASKNPFNKAFRFGYKLLITPIIKKNNIIVIRTQNDLYVEKFLGIPLSQSPWISVGTDVLLFHPNTLSRQLFRNKHGISENDFVIVYTGKLDDAKGGKFLAEAFKKPIKNNKIVLLVVGNSDGVYGEEVESLFKESENRVIRFPTQKYIDLPQFYQAADLSVFPRQCSLSFYDAQACGLPVVSEDNQINIDRLKYNNGINFKANDINDFREKIQICIDMEVSEYDKLKNNSLEFIKENYNYSFIAERYTDLIIEEVKKVNKNNNYV